MKETCRYCCNSLIDDELTPENDLSYIGIGAVNRGYGMDIRTGSNRPTKIIVTHFKGEQRGHIVVASYIMKYCPECGRKLTENSNYRRIV